MCDNFVYMTCVRLAMAAVSILFAREAVAVSSAGARAAVAQALPALQRSAAAFVANRSCVSCHHNVLPILTLHAARDRGIPIDADVLAAVENKTFRELREPRALDDAIQASSLSDPTPNDSYLLVAAHAAGVAPDLTTGVFARRILSWQRDGHWITSDFRPPHSSSLFTATATGLRAVQLFLPDEMRVDRDRAIALAAGWLTRTRPASTEDATFRLLGLIWASAPHEAVVAATRDLLAMRANGSGWPQLPGYPVDAYSTGEALYALHEAGLPTERAAWRDGLNFLLRTQERDGTWHVRSRMISPAVVSPSYFNTEFPYEKDEFLSYAGSNWAVLAILAALPIDASSGAKTSRRSESPEPPWMRAALFGSAAALGELLDRGLDPNSETEHGTSVLMAAATDPTKVQVLLGRGADPRHRARSGYDALTVAAAAYGSGDAVAALVGAGAPAQPPADVRVRHSPLLLACMTGDSAVVRTLLAHGADPAGGANVQGETPLAAAVTYGHAPVARLLVDAGAPSSLTESSGINLLHWATITNHATVVPVLAAARVAIDAQDDSGYTPLMYAATIDFGDAATLEALVAAGADPTIRNDEGRTPLQQARHYKHGRLAAALKKTQKKQTP